MHRRQFTRTSIALGAAVSAGAAIASPLAAQTPETSGTPDASPAASPAAASGTWNSAEDNVTVEYDPEIFGDATTSGVTGEWCVLRVPDIDRFMSVIIMLEDKYPTDEAELKDYVENSDEYFGVAESAEVEKLEFTEGNGALGVFYTAPDEAAPDTWGYDEFIPGVAGEHRTIHTWINSRRSKFDRELVESALSTLTINGEPAVRAIELTALLDKVEALEVPAE